VWLDRAFLSSTARDGEPTLVHGYAMTGHVAQGATVDRAFVLASEGMSREWAYVALSRGRISNRLYVAAQTDDARAEFAPTSPESRDPVERLAAALRESDAQVLAIDSGMPANEARREAERAVARASLERQALEVRRAKWLPGRRRELELARERERAAIEGLGEAKLREAEVRHGRRDFVCERELQVQRDALLVRMGERMTERVQQDRSIGRER
jgi:hypothetical protein